MCNPTSRVSNHFRMLGIIESIWECYTIPPFVLPVISIKSRRYKLLSSLLILTFCHQDSNGCWHPPIYVCLTCCMLYVCSKRETAICCHLGPSLLFHAEIDLTNHINQWCVCLISALTRDSLLLARCAPLLPNTHFLVQQPQLLIFPNVSPLSRQEIGYGWGHGWAVILLRVQVRIFLSNSGLEELSRKFGSWNLMKNYQLFVTIGHSLLIIKIHQKLYY